MTLQRIRAVNRSHVMPCVSLNLVQTIPPEHTGAISTLVRPFNVYLGLIDLTWTTVVRRPM